VYQFCFGYFDVLRSYNIRQFWKSSNFLWDPKKIVLGLDGKNSIKDAQKVKLQI
jgi:hypothetical protein